MLIVAAHRLTTFVLKSVSGALAAMGVGVTANHLDWASPYGVDFGAILWQLFVVNQLSSIHPTVDWHVRLAGEMIILKKSITTFYVTTS